MTISHTSTATDIVRAIAAREVSAREVTELFLARIAALNPTINAICTLNPAARDDAIAIDARLSAGHAARPLEGVPVLVKDNLETRGLKTTFGSRLMEHNIPDEDAIVVARLRAAGAVVIGKTNTPEFAADPHTSNFLFGTTRNPWDLMRTAGGSSGGTGAGIAAGFAPIGLGTDLGGSVRIPASFNGIVGIRPAPGRVPVYPAEFGWDTLVEHVVGPMAANVSDAALMLSVLAGPDDRDPSTLPDEGRDFRGAADGGSSLAGRRIAFCADLGGLAPVAPTVRELALTAARTFEGLGCTVEEDSFDARDLVQIIGGTRSFGLVGRFAERYAQSADLMTAPLRNQIEAALKVDLGAVCRAEASRTAYWRRASAFLERYDYIIAPVCGDVPFRLDRPLPDHVGGRPVGRFYDIFLMTYGFSVTGLPAVAVPCGFTADGLPVGIQILAHRMREDLAIEAAAAFERARPDFFRRPTIDPATAKPIPAVLPTPGMMIAER
jgi:amidase